MKHLLSIEKMAPADLEQILAETKDMKATRGQSKDLPLAGQTWAMIFTKSSTRTRVSFEVGIRELGGWVMFLSKNDIQMGRGEPIEDTARVLGRMVHGAVIRTFEQKDVEDFAHHARIPTINALTDAEHPCQILTDLFTIQEKLGSYRNKVIAFIGDGACNVPVSWIFAAAKLGFEFRIAAPKEFQPPLALLERAGFNHVQSQPGAKGETIRADLPATGAKIMLTPDCAEAATGADVLYTDTLVSMGKEDEAAERIAALAGYQINAGLLAVAQPHAIVMHCLPAYRGKEIDAETFEAHAQTIFDQAENRLHTQKTIVKWLVS